MRLNHIHLDSVFGIRFRFVSCLFLSLILLWTGLVKAEGLLPQKTQENQCIRIVNALEKNHYLNKRLDNQMSSQIFDLYIKRLDPSRSLLTRSDLNRLNRFRYSLDNDLVQGNLDLAFEIFNLYQSRAVKRLETILGLAKTWEKSIPVDSNREIIIDNENRPFQENLEDLKRIWKDDLINHIITLKLDGKENKEISETLEKIYSSRLTRLSQTNSNDVFQLFMNSVTASFDPHTQYFPPRASEDFDIHMSLSLEGIGAVLQNEYEYTKVVRLIPKGPADESNLLMPGDKIIGVGQGKDGEIKDTIGQRIDKVVQQIRGPKNTYVRLKIIPAKKADSTATISIKRDRVKLEDQSAKKEVVSLEKDNKTYKIGIIEIPNFYIDFAAYHRGDKNYKSTTFDVKKLLFELKEEKINGLIIDLRDNGGGSLKEANDLTGLFLKTGPTVQIKTKHRITRLYDEDRSIEYTGPLIVLINRMSASASEIFAGAIKDYHRGIIVGTRSFGKGTVQELKTIGDGKLKLTSAKFYRVSGESTQNKGIEPDIHYPRIYKIENIGESSLDGALPWDTILRTRYKAYPSLKPLFTTLEERYQDRSSHAPGMIYLKKRIEMTTRLSSQNRLSLNIKQREEKRARDEAGELEIENEYLTAMGEKPLDSLDDIDPKIKEYKDIIMNQTHLVMADFISLAQDKGYSWQ
ncbi:carboxy terminal-processing peptidase [Desulfospira joergensenii]|uniref:carboxy terminal-processing peptidase n=1 Tax=Desulfospira joergensenii TaxID=53329 RepID=UPI0003B348C1|nr:carboxy terminal-processing peptidase [Desulfospira joergensenii]